MNSHFNRKYLFRHTFPPVVVYSAGNALLIIVWRAVLVHVSGGSIMCLDSRTGVM